MTDRPGIDEINSDQLDALYNRLDGYEAAERFRKAATEATRPASPAVVAANAGTAVRRGLAAGVQSCDEAADMVRATGALRDQIVTGVRSLLYQDLPGDMSEHIADAVDKVVAPVLARFKQTNSDLARALLAPTAAETEATARVFAGLHRSAEQDVTRVIDLYERWVKEGAPPLGVPLARWWDRHLVELREAIVPPKEQTMDQQEQAAPVDWQAIVKRREAELKTVDRARRAAEQRAEAAARLGTQHMVDAERYQAERDGAYRERAHLVALLAALTPDAVITDAADIEEPGWQIAYLNIGGRQASWHISPGDADLFAPIEQVGPDDPRAQWDGHTTEDKYAGIAAHTVELMERCGPECSEMHAETGRCEIARVREDR